jgi:hypothetical protein
MVAVTCTADDEAGVIMWREGHDSGEKADEAATASALEEPALHQTVEVGELGSMPASLASSAQTDVEGTQLDVP